MDTTIKETIRDMIKERQQRTDQVVEEWQKGYIVALVHVLDLIEASEKKISVEEHIRKRQESTIL